MVMIMRRRIPTAVATEKTMIQSCVESVLSNILSEDELDYLRKYVNYEIKE
jgi:hypothetical protein